MHSAMALLLFPTAAHASGEGALRTIAGQAGIAGLLFLELVILHLSARGALSARRRSLRLALALSAMGAQYSLVSFATRSEHSPLVLPLAIVLLSLGLFPFLALGQRLPRRWLVRAGWAALAFLLALTLGIRLHTGPLFDWAAVRQELSFAASFNARFGPFRWFLGFFQDDLLRLFWWVLALILVGGAFIVQALAGPPAPAPRAPAKQLPLYAPRRGARRKRR